MYDGVCVVCPVWISACDSRALSYASTSSNHGQSLSFIAISRATSLSANSTRMRLAEESPAVSVQYVSKPKSANAQARGDVKFSAAGSAI